MIGSRCIHKKTLHVGKITSELDATKDFDAQWGVYWYGSADGPEHKIACQQGILNHWQNKTDIDVMKSKEFSLTDGQYYEASEFPLTHMSLNVFTSKTNRSNSQTIFLFELCDNSYEKLKQLEVQIKNCFYFGCPGDKEEAERILTMIPKSDYFKLN